MAFFFYSLFSFFHVLNDGLFLIFLGDLNRFIKIQIRIGFGQ